MALLPLSGKRYKMATYDSRIEKLEEELSRLKERVRKLESIAYYQRLSTDKRLNLFCSAEGIISDLYGVEVTSFTNHSPMQRRKRGHNLNEYQRAFLALLCLLRSFGVPYNVIDAHYKTGSFNKIAQYQTYLSFNAKENERYTNAVNQCSTAI